MNIKLLEHKRKTKEISLEKIQLSIRDFENIGKLLENLDNTCELFIVKGNLYKVLLEDERIDKNYIRLNRKVYIDLNFRGQLFKGISLKPKIKNLNIIYCKSNSSILEIFHEIYHIQEVFSTSKNDYHFKKQDNMDYRPDPEYEKYQISYLGNEFYADYRATNLFFKLYHQEDEFFINVLKKGIPDLNVLEYRFKLYFQKDYPVDSIFWCVLYYLPQFLAKLIVLKKNNYSHQEFENHWIYFVNELKNIDILVANFMIHLGLVFTMHKDNPNILLKNLRFLIFDFIQNKHQKIRNNVK